MKRILGFVLSATIHDPPDPAPSSIRDRQLTEGAVAAPDTATPAFHQSTVAARPYQLNSEAPD